MEDVGLKMINKHFWKNKKVFLTGHTGFKGSWISLWLNHLGATVKGYALKPPTSPSLYAEAKIGDVIESEFGDIRNMECLKKCMTDFDPDIVIHMAAQPLVRYSYDEPIETYEVNVLGTVKVLEAARACKNVKAIVNVTTDKCYENKEWVWGYREDEPMGGFDPYSSSKGCSELVSSAYRRSFFQNIGIGLATARAGNVIGGGDWAVDRLVPDILRAFEKGEPVVVRNPASIRPWQHVLEPLSGYLVLAEKLYNEPGIYSEGWNFGPYEEDAKTVSWILEFLCKHWEGAEWKLDENAHPHEAGYLKLDISKVKEKLCWAPTWRLDKSLLKILEWHEAWVNKQNVQKKCLDEIEDYMRDMAYAE